MKRNILYALAASVCLLFATGCSEWLDVKPYDKIAEDDLLSTEEGYMKLLNGIYIELNRDMLYGGALSVEMLEIMGGAYVIGSDNAVWGNYRDLSEYKYGSDYWRARLNEIWNKAYSLILNCNLLLESIEGSRHLFTEDNFNVIKGEAMALRAMLHFDMLRLFGPVFSRNSNQQSIPYYKAYSMEPQPVRPAGEIAELIWNDLMEARILLSQDPVRKEGMMMDDVSSGTSVFMKYRNLRLNYYAVTALLARSALYFGNKESALKYALEVIETVKNGLISFVDRSLVTGSPDDPDRIFSSEVIFALSHSQRNSLFKDYYDPSRIPNFVFRMDNEMMSNMIYGGGMTTGGSLDDYRYRVNWVATGANRYFYKYSDMVDTGNIRNTMIPMIRLGEMYLIAAEAKSEDLSAGLSYVNVLRSNRGVNPLSALTYENLQYEYIRELYGEGQIFFMYKRMFSPILRSSQAGGPVEPEDKVFVLPLPDSEIEN